MPSSAVESMCHSGAKTTARILRHHPHRKTIMANATSNSRHRGRLHVLRDRLKRATRDAKRGLPGAKERVAAHTVKRAQYRAANP